MIPILKARRGFSLLEALIVIVIVALLATLSIPFYGSLRQKAGLAGCLSNMRIVGLGLNGYMQENNMVWPQIPPAGFGSDEQRSLWWEGQLKPFGVDQKHWICPNDVTPQNSQLNNTDFVSSYMVCPFDELPNTAFRWKQPWVIERSGAHGPTRGANILMPDGTIQEGTLFR